MSHLSNKSSIALCPVSFCPGLLSAKGSFDFPMTNDYMFRAVLQSNNKALTGLISSLLHIPCDEITSVKITNPIVLGDDCRDKEFRLDINVFLNDLSLINLEMQVASYANWPDRSLVYLCRSFDTLSRGQDYAGLKPVVHVSLLDFSLPAKQSEFYSKNMLMNVKNHEIYSDKISLYVLNLNHIELATEEDKAWNIDRWAKLFKTSTWEELKMTAANNEYLTEASNSIFQMNTDDMMRKRCLDREEYYRDIRTWKRDKAERDAIIAKQEAIIAEKDASIAEKDASIAEMDASIAEKERLIAELQARLAAMEK